MLVGGQLRLSQQASMCRIGCPEAACEFPCGSELLPQCRKVGGDISREGDASWFCRGVEVILEVRHIC